MLSRNTRLPPVVVPTSDSSPSGSSPRAGRGWNLPFSLKLFNGLGRSPRASASNIEPAAPASAHAGSPALPSLGGQLQFSGENAEAGDGRGSDTPEYGDDPWRDNAECTLPVFGLGAAAPTKLWPASHFQSGFGGNCNGGNGGCEVRGPESCVQTVASHHPPSFPALRTVTCMSSVTTDSDMDDSSGSGSTDGRKRRCSAFDGVCAAAGNDSASASVATPLSTRNARRSSRTGPSPRERLCTTRLLLHQSQVAGAGSPVSPPSLLTPVPPPVGGSCSDDVNLSGMRAIPLPTIADSPCQGPPQVSTNPFRRMRTGSATSSPVQGGDSFQPAPPSEPRGHASVVSPLVATRIIQKAATPVVIPEQAPYDAPLPRSSTLSVVTSPVFVPPAMNRSVSVDTGSAAVFVSPRGSRVPQSMWRTGTLIGEGSYGKVYRSLNVATGELCAMKVISLGWESQLPVSPSREGDVVAEIMSEVEVLSMLQHENIVRYLGTCRRPNSLSVLMEYVCGGSIRNVLDEFGTLEEPVMVEYMKQVLTGLEYLHSKMIVHGDVKSANVLVSSTGVVKLTDFGCSKILRDCGPTPRAAASAAPAAGGCSPGVGYTKLSGTVGFMAPEVVRQTGYGLKADIWSIGCMVIEMATGTGPWSHFSNKLSVMYHVASSAVTPHIPEGVSDGCKSFLARCFCRDPTERACATELLAHPWLACH